jgi:hypothetical protein
MLGVHCTCAQKGWCLCGSTWTALGCSDIVSLENSAVGVEIKG